MAESLWPDGLITCVLLQRGQGGRAEGERVMQIPTLAIGAAVEIIIHTTTITISSSA